jgi:hypothetical protein
MGTESSMTTKAKWIGGGTVAGILLTAVLNLTTAMAATEQKITNNADRLNKLEAKQELTDQTISEIKQKLERIVTILERLDKQTQKP